MKTITDAQFLHYCRLSAYRTARKQYDTTGRKDHRHEMEDAEQSLADAEKILDAENFPTFRSAT